MAKFFVRGTKAKFDAIADKTAYSDSIVFLTDTKQIYQNGVYYGLSDEDAQTLLQLKDSVAALKYFTTISGDSGSASASAAAQTLNLKGSTDKVVSTTVGTTGVSINVADMKAATASAAGTHGLVPAPKAGDQAKVLSGAGTWVAQTVNTDTKVTSAANHYTPAADTAAALNATDGSYVSGVTRDAKGHVVGLTETALPTLSDLGGVVSTRKVEAGTGLTGGGALSADVTISHGIAPTTAASTKSATANQVITGVGIDSFGHVASITSKSLTADYIPNLASSKITACTGYTVGTDAAVSATDSLNTALGKVQGQINALKTSTSGLTGALLFKGVLDEIPTTSDYNSGDVIIVDGVEYVLTVSETTKSWEPFGDQSLMGQLETKIENLEKRPGLDKVGTVTSVAATENSGIAIAGTDANPTVGIATGYKLPTTTEWNTETDKVSFPGYGTVDPKANGTPVVGTSSKVAREDHVHPLQTTVSGNAGSATKLATARTISLSGDATGSASFDGTANASIAVSLEWEEL